MKKYFFIYRKLISGKLNGSRKFNESRKKLNILCNFELCNGIEQNVRANFFFVIYFLLFLIKKKRFSNT